MAARLRALRDDGIDAVRLEPARLLHRRRRRNHDRTRPPSRDRTAPSPAGRNESSRRAAGTPRPARTPPRRTARAAMRSSAARRPARGDTRQAARPTSPPAPRRRRRRVAEEVQVERLVRTLTNDLHLGAAPVPATSIAHGSEPNPPASLTAIASAEPCAPAIGACTMGCSMPKRSSRRRSRHMLFTTCCRAAFYHVQRVKRRAPSVQGTRLPLIHTVFLDFATRA